MQLLNSPSVETPTPDGKVTTPTPPRPLRVLYYIAYFQRMAGANRSLFELITHLPDTVTPLVVIAGEGRAAEAYRQAGIEVVIMPPGHHLNQFGKVMLSWSWFKRAEVALTELLPYTLHCWTLMREWQPDIVHVNCSRSNLMIGAAARLYGCPVVGHMRVQLAFNDISQWYFEQITHRIITVCDAIQADLSPAARQKTTTIYNGIQQVAQSGQLSPWVQSLKDQGTLIVACFASVVPFKGQHHLLDAIAELNRRGWSDRLAVFCVGDIEAEYQDYADFLMAKLRHLGIPNVTFTGWQSNPFPFYQGADVEVLPSVTREVLDYGDRQVTVKGNEGFPRTHLEAMHFGLPVVGTDIAGVREQITDGVNGYVVPPGDALALADALEKLLQDSDLRSQMGQVGRDRVQQQFSTAVHVASMMRVYQELTGDRRPQTETESHGLLGHTT